MNYLPAFHEMIIPAYEIVLRNNGSCNNKTVLEGIIHDLEIPDNIVNLTHKVTGNPELVYRLGWAKTYMKKYGILSDASEKGEWILSDFYSVHRPIDVKKLLKTVREGGIGLDNPSRWLYVLTNKAFPDYVKVGYTDNVEDTVKKLNSTNTTPFPFEVFCTYGVDVNNAGIYFQNMLSCISPSVTDFFNIPPEEVYTLLTMVAKLHRREDKLIRWDGTTIIGGGGGGHLVKKKKPPFKFSMVDMHKGDVITFINDTSITAVVASDNKIRYKGEITSLSSLAQFLLKKETPVQGTIYFTYQGETLDERRTRFESKKG